MNFQATISFQKTSTLWNFYCSPINVFLLWLSEYMTFQPLGSIHTWDLHVLDVNYCVKYSLNNGLYCTKWTYSDLLFGQWTEKFNN